MLEIVADLIGDGDSSISGKIKEAINALKDGVSSEYDTLKKIEDIIRAHLTDYNNPHKISKNQIDLGNVTNDAQVKRDEMGQPNGVATLNEGGVIPKE